MDLTITDTASAPMTPNAPVGAPRFVFVYGTLRRGEERDINRLSPAPVFIGASQTPGTLYDLGACNYPGIRLGGSTWVNGDVYQIAPELERQLDEIEHVFPTESAEYARREIAVECAERALTCLVYEVAEARISDKTVIASGDWVTR